MTSPHEASIRKLVSYVEEIYSDGGKSAEKPLRLIGAAAVLSNPWAGMGYVENLKPEIRRLAPILGHMLTAEILKHAGGGAAVEAYGKAAIVGVNGEIEHASALIHTLRFGNVYRTAVGAKSYLSFTNVRGGPGAPIAIPMMHKHDEGMRSHYLTLQFSIIDAPGPDEIVVALGGSVGGRPHHRIGDRRQDIKELESGDA
ncbi:MAG: amino acid synthesis family protein [Hyphomicrobiales bacterium]|nr:amino acid synthesis family protein [Hyphomicrobiales bacterium]